MRAVDCSVSIIFMPAASSPGQLLSRWIKGDSSAAAASSNLQEGRKEASAVDPGMARYGTPCPFFNNVRSSARYEPDNKYDYNCADGRVDDVTYEPPADIEADPRQQPTRNNSANDTKYDVSDEAVAAAAFHDLAS
jgi:hypothetical protein